MKSNSYLSYYLSLFSGLRDNINSLIYNDGSSLKKPSDKDILIGIAEREKFSFMLMISENSGKDFRWLLLEDQKEIVMNVLKNNNEYKSNLNSLNIEAEEFFNKWIAFKLGKSGMVQYFNSSKKDTDFIVNFQFETYLIKDGYFKDFEANNYYQDQDFINSVKTLKKDPLSFLESIWGFADVQFYYIKLPKFNDLEFIGIFPILLDAGKESVFFDNANFIFSMFKSAVHGANLMRHKMDEHLTELKKAQLKTAIIAILVDSFSHNISAHSLSAIIWLYLKRVEKLSKRFLIDKATLKRNNDQIVVNNKELNSISSDAVVEFDKLDIKDTTYSTTYFSLLDILKHMSSDIRNKIFTFEKIKFFKDNEENPEFPLPIDSELVILLKYLNEKSAFWNGVTRDIPSGGYQQNLYDLFNDFFSNTLFLGTIAHSEKTNRVIVKIGVDEDPKDYLIIDIKDLMDGTCNNIKFTTLCDSFKVIRDKLKECKSAFLPGSLIGKHALFTIWENTLRNIKHCKINKEGIIFCIKINTKIPKLFSFDIYLENPPQMSENLKSRIEYVEKLSILTEDGKFILGGSSQDKICASMLITNRFSNVEENFSYSIGDNDDKIDIENPWINISVDEKPLVHKKYFMWKGDDIVKLTKVDFPELNSVLVFNENISRFKFSVFDMKEVPGSLIAENGLIRYFDKNEFENVDENIIYTLWNNKWIKFEEKEVIHFGKGTSIYWHIYKDVKEGWKIRFNKSEKPGNDKQISFLHGEEQNENNNIPKLQFRTHGPVIQRFFKGDDEFKKNSLQYEAELIETFLTKIMIIDNRIESRVSERDRKEILNSIFLNVNSEEHSNFNNDVLNKIREINPNIFIIHLSFIESLNYHESNISKFINDYFYDQNRGCFLLDSQTKLIITTGRGRGLWWDNLKEDKKLEKIIQHILFKPIDSLLNAVEDGLIFKDDFMVKYNLLKEIFGS